jgi:serine/threonine protein kinase
VGILLTVDHPNVIKLKEIYESEKEVHLVLELVTGGELFDRIIDLGYFCEKDAAAVIKQLLEALEYIHARSIVHRDLKVIFTCMTINKHDCRFDDFSNELCVDPVFLMWLWNFGEGYRKLYRTWLKFYVLALA